MANRNERSGPGSPAGEERGAQPWPEYPKTPEQHQELQAKLAAHPAVRALTAAQAFIAGHYDCEFPSCHACGHSPAWVLQLAAIRASEGVAFPPAIDKVREIVKAITPEMIEERLSGAASPHARYGVPGPEPRCPKCQSRRISVVFEPDWNVRPSRAFCESCFYRGYNESVSAFFPSTLPPAADTMSKLLEAVEKFIRERGTHPGTDHKFCCSNNGRCLRCEESYIRAESELDDAVRSAKNQPAPSSEEMAGKVVDALRAAYGSEEIWYDDAKAIVLSVLKGGGQ